MFLDDQCWCAKAVGDLNDGRLKRVRRFGRIDRLRELLKNAVARNRFKDRLFQPGLNAPSYLGLHDQSGQKTDHQQQQRRDDSIGFNVAECIFGQQLDLGPDFDQRSLAILPRL